MNFEIILNEHTPQVTVAIPDVPAFIDEHKEMLKAFLKFANDQGNRAVGLAANQVSLNGQRLMLPFFAAKNIKYGNWGLFICPQIKPIGMLQKKVEGCLTYPGKSIIATRAVACEVKYYNEHKSNLTEVFQGFTAQIMQHECNHLMGFPELVVDKLSDREQENLLALNPKLQRNDVCLCGSGQKFKNCCIKWL